MLYIKMMLLKCSIDTKRKFWDKFVFE